MGSFFSGILDSTVGYFLLTSPLRAAEAILARLRPVSTLIPYLPWASCALLGLLFFRWRQRLELAYSYPRLANLLHRAWVGPVVFLLVVASLLFGSLHSFRRFVSAEMVGYSICLGAFLVYPALAWLVYRVFPFVRRRGYIGTASWAAQSDVRVARHAPWKLPLMVGFRPGRRPPRHDLGLCVLGPSPATNCRHTLILGGSGGGKGESVLGHIIHTSTTSLIYQDVKAECPNILVRWAARGKPPIVWGAGRQGGWPSLSWNPLQEVYDARDSEDSCAALAAAILPAPGGENAWVTDTARLLLSHVIASRTYPTLAAIYDDLKHHGLSHLLDRSGSTPGLTEQLQGKNVKEYASNTLQTTLERFATGWARQVTSQHRFRLKDVLRGADCYVLSLEPEEERRLPLQVFWRMLFRRLKKWPMKLDLTLLLDEGLAAGYLPKLDDTLNTVRSLGAAVVFCVQNTGGLKPTYRNETEAILQAFASRIVLFNGLNPEDRETLSRQLGEYSMVRGPHLSSTKSEQTARLLPVDVAETLAQRGEYWGVIRMPGATVNGRPILARMPRARFEVAKPTAETIDALRRAWPPRPAKTLTPETAPPEPEPQPPRTVFGF